MKSKNFVSNVEHLGNTYSFNNDREYILAFHTKQNVSIYFVCQKLKHHNIYFWHMCVKYLETKNDSQTAIILSQIKQITMYCVNIKFV